MKEGGSSAWVDALITKDVKVWGLVYVVVWNTGLKDEARFLTPPMLEPDRYYPDLVPTSVLFWLFHHDPMEQSNPVKGF